MLNGPYTQERVYLGLSTDPFPSGDVPPHSVFRQLDTNNIYRYDGTSWYIELSTIDGMPPVVPYVWDIITASYVPSEKYVRLSPMVDIDTSYVWNPDGTPAQKIEVGLGNTKTTVYTWLKGILQNKVVVIT